MLWRAASSYHSISPVNTIKRREKVDENAREQQKQSTLNTNIRLSIATFDKPVFIAFESIDPAQLHE
jgi:hypothetical protein